MNTHVLIDWPASCSKVLSLALGADAPGSICRASASSSVVMVMPTSLPGRSRRMGMSLATSADFVRIDTSGEKGPVAPASASRHARVRPREASSGWYGSVTLESRIVG
ncbi:MAG: hypothetical protein BWY92_01889 [Firmicutes bacterium ADurb.BinA052]|nr:MAG: hypothetical protein BWY92_01889 [Firmicutes bacterium ADurb.BinA052]